MEINDLYIKNIFYEISELFRFIDYDILKKIPKNIRNYIYINRNQKHKFKYDIEKPLEEQEFMEDTKDFFSAIYLKYCCDEEERKKLINICIENEKEFERQKILKYNSDNIFKKVEQENTQTINEKTQLIEYKETFFVKFRNFIFKIFNKKN